MKCLSLRIFFLLSFFVSLTFISLINPSHSYAYNYSELVITGNASYIFPSTYQIANLLPEVNCSSILYAAVQQGPIDSTKSYYANLLNVFQGFGSCQQLTSNSLRVTNLSVSPPDGGDYFIIFSTVANGATGYGTAFFSIPSLITPTPFDTLTPTPTPSTINLPVPLFKQNGLPWGVKTYDSANKWSPQNPTIARWGCALTSAAMILNYYGINKLPGGVIDVDPGSLNWWLKGTDDGYVKEGLLNWVAIEELSKKAAPYNNITSFDALIYHRKEFEDSATLTSNLHAGIPGILQETESDGGTHFVVAKGVSNNVFTINDPYFHRDTLADGYNNHFDNVGWYTPSHTDLSYILLVSDPEVTLSLKDSNGNTVAKSFIQQPISAEENGGTANAHGASMLYYQAPNEGIYDVVATSSDDKTHTIDTYSYDTSGNVNIIHVNSDGSYLSQDFSLFFNKLDSSKSFEEKNYVQLFTTVLKDIAVNFWTGSIDNGSYSSLSAILEDAQKQYLSAKTSIAKTKVQDALQLLNAKRGKGISETAYQIILSDLNSLSQEL